MRKYFIIIATLLIMLSGNKAFCQGSTYNGPNDPAGDPAAERTSWMDGNDVLLFFRNTTELSNCCGQVWSMWPNNYDGTKMHDGIATLVGARVYLENDTIPVTEGYENRTDLDTLYYIQSSFREHMDKDETLTIEYGLYPVFGYFNELSETPAMSNDSTSWPTDGWPAQTGTKWAGQWNGRYGSGIIKADLETYFVTNDAQDQEYIADDDPVTYYPRPDVKIGDIDPAVTIQNGLPWGGIGIRLETRGYQWSNASAADAIFWEHNLSNISDYDLPEMTIGFWMDNAVGGESNPGDDLAYYNTELNMAYSWDIDFVSSGSSAQPGILGFAYLESPGLPYDGIDNDDDGLVDEARDNTASSLVGAYDGIADLDKFLDYYSLSEEDLVEHWDADEDQDWVDGVDANGNGVYDDDEAANDDVGLDGIGPSDTNYPGPDADGTECNHRPDYQESVGCEPNFASTDVSESDMLGLTSFHYTSDINRTAKIYTDESLFLYMIDGEFHDFQDEPLNFMEFFASGIFPLYQGQTERVSMAELHSYDPLSGLSGDEHKAPALFRLKEVVQVIYETDYRFAQPPVMPTLTATPGDGKVILTWDDAADTQTREEFAGNVNDFEGYKLYRATDKKMSDAEEITDGYGSLTYKEPIFQCDLIDDVAGFADFGEINGVEYYLGDDTGIKHYYVDEDVQNGRTYYYVLVAYDYGLPDVGDGITPSENTYVIRLDEAEDIVEITKNVAIVKPQESAAGYVDPQIEVDEDAEFVGTNAISASIIINDDIKENHTYKMFFDVDTITHLRLTESVRHPFDMLYTNNGIRIYDETNSDSLVYEENPDDYSGENIKSDTYEITGGTEYEYYKFNENVFKTGVFDGLQVSLAEPTILPSVDLTNTGWFQGDAPITVSVNDYESMFFPWDYEIVFTSEDTATVTKTNSTKKITDGDNETVGPANLLLDQSFNFYVVNKSLKNEDGEYEKLDMVVYDKNQNDVFDYDEDEVIVGYTADYRGMGTKYYWAGTVFSIDFSSAYADDNMPQSGDIYQVKFNRPFIEDDCYEFTILPAEELDEDQLEEDMKNIKVVPNPYVVTNSMEASVANYALSQDRVIRFTHVPAKCKIQIFTVSGYLVDEINVNNSTDNLETDWDTNSSANGTAFWDLKSKEGLDVAAGYYIYRVKSLETGKEKAGKFAIIK